MPNAGPPGYAEPHCGHETSFPAAGVATEVVWAGPTPGDASTNVGPTAPRVTKRAVIAVLAAMREASRARPVAPSVTGHPTAFPLSAGAAPPRLCRANVRAACATSQWFRLR